MRSDRAQAKGDGETAVRTVLPHGDKAGWRRWLRAAWAELDRRELAAASRLICHRVLSLPCWYEATACLAYAPLAAEVDVTPLMEWAWRRGLAVLLPRPDPATRRMEAREVRSWADTEEGPYGLRVPKAGCPRRLPGVGTVALIPGLAFDCQGWRLGRGAGYYDRFLAEWRGVRRVGVTLERFVFPHLPRDSHDRRMDWVVTEEAIRGPWPGLR